MGGGGWLGHKGATHIDNYGITSLDDAQAMSTSHDLGEVRAITSTETATLVVAKKTIRTYDKIWEIYEIGYSSENGHSTNLGDGDTPVGNADGRESDQKSQLKRSTTRTGGQQLLKRMER